MLSEVLQMNSSISSVNNLFTLVQGSPKWPRNSENLQIFPLASCACSASFMPQKCFVSDLSFFTNTSEEQNKNSQLLICYTCWLSSWHQSHTVRQQTAVLTAVLIFHDIKDTVRQQTAVLTAVLPCSWHERHTVRQQTAVLTAVLPCSWHQRHTVRQQNSSAHICIFATFNSWLLTNQTRLQNCCELSFYSTPLTGWTVSKILLNWGPF